MNKPRTTWTWLQAMGATFLFLSCQGSPAEETTILPDQSLEVVEGLKFTFPNWKAGDAYIEGEVVCENLSGSQLHYGTFESRPIFYIKSREDMEVSRPRSLRPSIEDLFDTPEDDYRKFDLGETIAGRIIVGTEVENLWVGLSVANSTGNERVIWAGPFSREQVHDWASLSLPRK